MKQLPKHEDIDPNSKTIESGNIGIIIDGLHKGLKFTKTKDGIKFLGYDEIELKRALKFKFDENKNNE